MLDKKEIKHIANLARIEIDEKEEKKFGKELLASAPETQNDFIKVKAVFD